jgi:hypothetical protein
VEGVVVVVEAAVPAVEGVKCRSYEGCNGEKEYICIVA